MKQLRVTQAAVLNAKLRSQVGRASHAGTTRRLPPASGREEHLATAPAEPESLTITVETRRLQADKVAGPETQQPARVAEMSASTHYYNAQLIDHLTTLRKAMEHDKQSTALKDIGQTDCTRLINTCLLELKMLQFQCLKAVSSVEERLLPLKVNQPGDGSRAPARTIEVLPDCTVTVVVEVQDRKLPLKVHLQYEKKAKASRED